VIFTESPWVGIVLFVVPTFVISLVCYAICCLAPADDDDVAPSSDDEIDDLDSADCKISSPCIYVNSVCQEFCFAIQMQTVALNDRGCCLSCYLGGSSKTAEGIDVLFGAETPGDPRNIRLDGEEGGGSVQTLTNYFGPCVSENVSHFDFSFICC